MSIVEMKVPTIGESITEVTLSQWLKKNGEYVKMDEPICEFESDKATLEFPAEASGILIYVAKEGDDIEIGGLVAKIDTSAKHDPITGPEKIVDSPVQSPTESATLTPTPAKEEVSYASGHPSPAAAKILSEKGMSPQQVQGSGRDGRITKEDALAAEQIVDKGSTQPSMEPLPTRSKRNSRVEKMSRMRRTISKRLVSAKNNTAMLTTFNEVDLSEIMRLRKKYQDKFVEKYGIKLGFMSLFAKACAKALIEMPDVNAMIDGDNIVYNEFVDISIAISTPTGLVVPPIRNVEQLSLSEIEWGIKALADKARKGTLSLEEMQGGTFTITNGGVFGSMMSTPILNEPQSAILGMHAIIERPVAIKGQVEIRPMMYLALSYDHRIIDGSTSVTFLVKVKNYLEDPMSLFLDL
jgi:2-oxoglutarate dehydrogenase E2 component (dihydrolipoamide succinyltransferase)